MDEKKIIVASIILFIAVITIANAIRGDNTTQVKPNNETINNTIENKTGNKTIENTQNKTSEVSIMFVSEGDKYPIVDGVATILIGITGNKSFIVLNNISNCDYEIFSTIGKKIDYTTIKIPSSILVSLNMTKRENCSVNIEGWKIHVVKKVNYAVVESITQGNGSH